MSEKHWSARARSAAAATTKNRSTSTSTSSSSSSTSISTSRNRRLATLYRANPAASRLSGRPGRLLIGRQPKQPRDGKTTSRRGGGTDGQNRPAAARHPTQHSRTAETTKLRSRETASHNRPRGAAVFERETLTRRDKPRRSLEPRAWREEEGLQISLRKEERNPHASAPPPH